MFALLSFAGCTLAPKVASITSDDFSDPFLQQRLQQQQNSPPQQTTPTADAATDEEFRFLKTNLTNSQTADSPKADSLKAELQKENAEVEQESKTDTLTEEQINEEIPLETEKIQIFGETEQLEMLGQDVWVKNIAYINFQETGKKTEVSVSSADRQRRDTINRLNMSNKELAKKKNQKFEYVDGMISGWRWMHRSIEKLLSLNPELRTSPEVFLKSTKYRDPKYRIVRANAAILLGRDGNPAVKQYLFQLAQTETLSINLRCAALETLGHLQNVSADELQAKMSSVTDKQVSDEIQEEWLYALSEKINPWDSPAFSEPFATNSFNLRYAAAKIWRMKSEQRIEWSVNDQLPETFLEYARQENNPQIRVELIKTLGAWRTPNLYKLVEPDLHRGADVRNAAMSVLADSGCDEAIPAIKDKLHDPVSANRAAAVNALRKLGCIDEVLKLSKDEDQRVRSEVAQALAGRCSPATAILAKKYIEDRYDKVQLATLNAVSGWKIDESGPVILLAAKSPFQKIRQSAVALLERHDVQCESFDPALAPKEQRQEYELLVQAFHDAVGVSLPDDTENNQTAPTQREHSQTKPDKKQNGNRNDFVRDSFRDSDVPDVSDVSDVPASSKLRSQIAVLQSGTLPEQRKAAAEIAREFADVVPPDSDAKRILDVLMKQNDPIILTTLLTALREANPEIVKPIARTMLQAEQPEIRRLSCEMLKRVGESDDLPVLEQALRDPSRAVARGALQAIDSLCKNNADNNTNSAVATLRNMLVSADPSLQTDIAATLHRLGIPEGTETIRRLAQSKDNRLKCYVARTIAGLRDETFLPILLTYLDDGNGSVRSEALRALPVLTGKDVAGDAGSHTAEVSQTQRQISLWKTWATSRKGKL
ncbi:hypothetical protein FACS189454_05180 [Planctomycetales bacterium]|nr:hypothetical protein FACS189454_05180 [Planctomycetales bacterium]